MIRPFDWRDVRSLGRLEGRSLCLCAEAGMTRGAGGSLSAALLSVVGPGLGHPTLMYCPRRNGLAPSEAFGQLQHRPGEAIARLLCLAPAEMLEKSGGPELIEGLAAEAGRRGAHNLLAEVDDDTFGFEALRGIGFAVYARQETYALTGCGRVTPESHAAGDPMRPQSPVDETAIRLLYANTVPRLVQQVEANMPRRSGLVHSRRGELLGYFAVSQGPLGVWVEPTLHPAVEAVDELIAHLADRLTQREARPVYVCVRSYFDWLRAPLQRAGFEPCARQAVLVKRLALPLPQALPVRRRVVVDGGAKVTTPYVKHLGLGQSL